MEFKELGKRISETRVSLNLTQTDVARALSIKKKICEQSTISRIETGRYTGTFLVQYLAYLLLKSRERGDEIDLNEIIAQT